MKIIMHRRVNKYSALIYGEKKKQNGLTSLKTRWVDTCSRTSEAQRGMMAVTVVSTKILAILHKCVD